jgi:hypothetical protein
VLVAPPSAAVVLTADAPPPLVVPAVVDAPPSEFAPVEVVLVRVAPLVLLAPPLLLLVPPPAEGLPLVELVPVAVLELPPVSEPPPSLSSLQAAATKTAKTTEEKTTNRGEARSGICLNVYRSCHTEQGYRALERVITRARALRGWLDAILPTAAEIEGLRGRYAAGQSACAL